MGLGSRGVEGFDRVLCKVQLRNIKNISYQSI